MNDFEIILDEYINSINIDTKLKNNIIKYFSKDYIDSLFKYCKIQMDSSTIYSIITSDYVDKASNLENALIVRNTYQLLKDLLNLSNPLNINEIPYYINKWHDGLINADKTYIDSLINTLSKDFPVDILNFFDYISNIHYQIKEQNIGGVYSEIWSFLSLTLVCALMRIPPILLDITKINDYNHIIKEYYKDSTDLTLFLKENCEISLSKIIKLYKRHKSISREMLSNRISSFENKINELDKKVGLFSKEYFSQKEKEFIFWIKRIKEWCDDSFKNKDDLYYFDIKFPIRIENLPSVSMYKLVNNYRNQSENLLMSLIGSNLIDIYREGSSLLIELTSKRKYIPDAYLSFSLIPARYMIQIASVSAITIIKDKSNQYSLDENLQLNELSLSSDPGDWNEDEIESFFIESIDNFYSLLEDEIAKRTDK